MIIVTGSLAFDNIMDFPGKFANHILPEKLHVLSVSFLVDKMKKENGGTAGNIAYSLALLGQKCKVLGCVGTDFEDYRKHLERVGVDKTGIKVINREYTSSAMIMTDQMDNQITGFYPGAMKYNKDLRIKNYDLRKQEIDMVIISPNDPRAMLNFVKECRKLNIPYMFDPGMQLPRLTDKELANGVSGAKILIGNDYEMATIKKRFGNKNKKLFENVEVVIITLGGKGSVILANNKTVNVPPAKPKHISDPTGAGDAFRAGFLAGYLKGFPLPVCGRMGNLAAVYTVEKYGTQTHFYSKKDFCNRYSENFKGKLVL